jgi:hypothetical protein
MQVPVNIGNPQDLIDQIGDNETPGHLLDIQNKMANLNIKITVISALIKGHEDMCMGIGNNCK